MKKIHIQEVVTRDGFQIEGNFIPTEEKISLLNRLSNVGFSRIEVSSFVSPKAVPMLRDAKEVVAAIEKNPDVTYVCLVPNARGAETALSTDIDEINFVMSASETHNLANVRKTHEQSLEELATISSLIKGSTLKLNGSIATTFGCPYEGDVSEKTLFSVIEGYLKRNVMSVTLADTTGMANPAQVEALLGKVRSKWPELEVTLHFHNTRGMGFTNVLAGIRAGVNRYDAALGGLGGCPFAAGATGNICTEDLVHMLHAMGHETTVDLDELLGIAKDLPTIVGHDVPGQVIKAGKISDLHQAPTLSS
jgi:hydroxymethylglutaryl-CoA lyase